MQHYSSIIYSERESFEMKINFFEMQHQTEVYSTTNVIYKCTVAVHGIKYNGKTIKGIIHRIHTHIYIAMKFAFRIHPRMQRLHTRREREKALYLLQQYSLVVSRRPTGIRSAMDMLSLCSSPWLFRYTYIPICVCLSVYERRTSTCISTFHELCVYIYMRLLSDHVISTTG